MMPQASFCRYALPITHAWNLQVAFSLVPKLCVTLVKGWLQMLGYIGDYPPKAQLNVLQCVVDIA